MRDLCEKSAGTAQPVELSIYNERLANKKDLQTNVT